MDVQLSVSSSSLCAAKHLLKTELITSNTLITKAPYVNTIIIISQTIITIFTVQLCVLFSGSATDEDT